MLPVLSDDSSLPLILVADSAKRAAVKSFLTPFVSERWTCRGSRQPRSINTAISETTGAFGGIDFLSHNAGFAGATVPVTEYDPAEWQKIIDVNLVGTFRLCHAVVPVMQQAGFGRIVNMASLAGKEGTPNASAYSAAKAGVIGFTKSLGKELAETCQ